MFPSSSSAGRPATESIPHCSSQSARAWKSRVKVGKLRTGSGSRSALTATYSSLAPTSIPAASGCNIPSVSNLLLPLLAICSSEVAARMPGETEQTPNRDRCRKPANVITCLYATPDPRFSTGLQSSTNVGAGCSCHPRASGISSLDSRSFTSCLARASCMLARSNPGIWTPRNLVPNDRLRRVGRLLNTRRSPWHEESTFHRSVSVGCFVRNTLIHNIVQQDSL
jgi:hypothetical protein